MNCENPILTLNSPGLLEVAEKHFFCHISKHTPPEVHPPADLELGRFRPGPPADTSAELQRIPCGTENA